MAPKWPQVNNGPEHINEHATYLREACNKLQDMERGRKNQVPWNIVQQFLESTIALAGKVLRQPAVGEILQHVQDSVRCTQNMQKDISIIKNSVGLGTTPLNAANFSGGRPAAASWAQVAAQARGSPSLPPPAPQGIPATKTHSAVTAYKDRGLTVKLKDQGIVQRYRTHSAARTKQQVETSIRSNAATKLVKVIAAHQLKSGDIQIFTSTTAEATQLKQNKEWLRGLGEHAELIVPTYGVISHGIPTKSINLKDQKATIEQMLADNYTVVPNGKIACIGWLTKGSPLKRASSIVVEFTDPEAANAIIYAGMAWDGQIYQCQLYDRSCRIKQCFRCHNYGHIGTQCSAFQCCGYCAELHETKDCPQRAVEGFTPQCAVCKSAHTAWSNACPARKKELQRVEQAKQLRSTYWHVPLKEDFVQREALNQQHGKPRQETRDRTVPALEKPTTRSAAAAMARGNTNQARDEPELPPPTDPASDHPAAGETDIPVITIATPIALSDEEDWVTPAMLQDTARPLDQPAILQPDREGESDTHADADKHDTHNQQPQSQPYQMDDIDIDDAAFQEAEQWLSDIANDMGSGWLQDTGVEPSPLTSMATDTRTANGKVYKGCNCPSHQELYENWPTRDVELTIAKCMRVCVYCGKDYAVAAELRKHMRKKYTQRNITVAFETKGKWSSTTPGWSRLETASRRSDAPVTRNRALTDSPHTTPFA